MNEWLRRRMEKDRCRQSWYDKNWVTTAADIKELQNAMTVSLWVDAADGRHQLPFDALPFEGVITFSFVEEAVVSGYSIWLGGKEIFWQRFEEGEYRVARHDSINILSDGLNMELTPLALS
jgi:hypothetical protein